jgi:hypothetical protein
LFRWSLIFGKKRGERRTGSTVAGRAALGLFAAFFFTAGIISLVFILLKFSIPEWRANHNFAETTCQIISTRTAADSAGAKRPEIEVAYTVDDRPQTAWSTYDIAAVYQADGAFTEKILEEFTAGTECDCWYDPRDPQTVVLARGYTWFAWLMLLVPIAFISLGGAGLALAVLTWGKSTERIAATTQNTSNLDFLLPTPAAPAQPFPFVPDPHQLNDSPGTFLSYRLTPGTAVWSTAAIAVVCAMWNLAVIVFGRMCVLSFRNGERDWWLALFLLPLVAGGVFSLILFVRRLLIAANIGPTLVEISAHPLVPGGTYEIYLSQAGRLAVKKFDLKLVCEENATYRQGTNTRKSTRRVFEESLVSRESFKLGPGVPFEARARLFVPYDAMHSFKAGHNRVDWKIVVAGDVERWPGFERTFPIVIRPRKLVEDNS